MKQFTNLYQLSKTLRFELKPIGITKENIETSGILERDNQRAVGSYLNNQRQKDKLEQSSLLTLERLGRKR